MTTKNAIKLLNSIRKIIMRDDSWLANTHEPINEAFNMAQKALKQTEWIPCSERLPKIGKEVLLSEPNTMFIAEYHGSGDPEGLWLVDGLHHYLADVNGCAWMPLPEPYNGG